MNWKEFKEKNKIRTEDTGETEGCFLREKDEPEARKQYKELVAKIGKTNAANYKISPLWNEDGEYEECFLEEIQIGEITISAEGHRGGHDENGEHADWAELIITKTEKS